MKCARLVFSLIMLCALQLAADDAAQVERIEDVHLQDRIEIIGGTVLIGTIEQVEASTLELSTDYAGTFTVDLSKVEKVVLEPLREIGVPPELLAEREVKPGPEIAREEPSKPTPVNAAGETLPNWKLETGLDFTGTRGNTERIDLRVSLKAELEREFDRTNLYSRYNFGRNRGVRSANEIILGGRYTNFLLERTGLFFREEVERDDFEGIYLRSTSAAGFSHKFKDQKDLQVEARSGVSYRYEDYIDDGSKEIPGMDLGVDVLWQMTEWANFKGSYTFLPSVEDFEEFIFEQDSGFNLPLNPKDFWKLRLGVASQYNNRPDNDREPLDIRYYLQLIATWK